MNVVVVRGALSRPPEERALPSGDRLVAYEVTVRVEGQKAESVPVVRIGPGGARGTPVDLVAGTEVVAVGRVRRRFFRAGGATASRTEVVADVVVPAADRRRTRAALDRARRAVEA